MSIFGSQTSSESLTTPLTNELNSLCVQLASQGGTLPAAGHRGEPGARLHQPGRQSSDRRPVQRGEDRGHHRRAVPRGPFGPTVAGLGGTVSFFEGS